MLFSLDCCCSLPKKITNFHYVSGVLFGTADRLNVALKILKICWKTAFCQGKIMDSALNKELNPAW